ncbi:MAG: hypothetical protein HLUCCA11_12415 [Phormidesmis priestleyi Ana]|uniref:Uncharacterized protein n=1 Tax=Phormidesmis priestleyi Ana TaxID=1666911 RepID=A0A0P8BMP3_9CYAN|nr:MAG: hypothetical protein HLUCCA11_12415 [Phormidesmis priestleyi Ana]
MLNRPEGGVFAKTRPGLAIKNTAKTQLKVAF